MDQYTSVATSHLDHAGDHADANSNNLGYVVSVSQVDRWSINLRLRELNIPCTCPADGTLRVNANHPIALLLVNSVVRRFKVPRQTSVDWLERCWSSRVACSVVF
ncbi:hypothetical protein S7335_5459 [Synechococcus sp. PCC 7335]|uniref:Asr1405/Asl0597 family protein n=1 Tax=Synechococcus sp. (strain ATCC 29403 / PCC 7335) TaxID=91464 RepID=UPI00017EC7C4|nr:Asr1405/Asl0597 family protein [Synechococcus sp. PCC 7335]EDX87749.1 hypothetical protein S7335_5459 [Synechococcus sp. PCC 7335]